jgi:hypothetical protein
VAGAIHNEFAAEVFAVAVAGVEGGDGVDATADGAGGVDVFVEEQGDVFLGADEGFLLASPNSSNVPGEFLARSANSSTISPMSGYLPRRTRPMAQTRISEEPLPPSTGRF